MSAYKRIRSRLGRIALGLGLDLRLHTTDRAELERGIFPYFIGEPSFDKILFVGCDWYTRGYRKLFRHKTYYTLDVEADRAFFGGPRHVVDSAANVAGHFAPGQLDLIFFNGVFGWGLNDRESMQRTIAGFHTTLRPGGVVLIGWDDVPERLPFPITEVPALAQFHPWTFPPYGSSQRHIPGEFHKVYDFFSKP